MLKKAGFIICCLLILPIAQYCSQKSSEIYVNGGFEAKSSDGDNPEGWRVSGLSEMADYVEFRWDEEVARSGQRSVSIHIKEDFPEQNLGDSIVYYETKKFKYEKAKTYEVTGWIKTQNVKNPAFLEVQCKGWPKANEAWKVVKTYSSTGSKDWAQLMGSFARYKGRKDQAYFQIRVGIPLSKNEGSEVWFDDIQLRILDD